MEKVILEAEKRTLTGKKVNRLRKEGKIPAVIYGRDYEATPITLDKRNTTNSLSKVSSSTILTILLDGQEQASLVREIQKDFIRNEIIHIDFLAVSSKEKLRTNVSITLVGVAPVLEEFDALMVNGIENIEVECYPQDLPESIEVDLSSLKELGDAIYLKDIPAPANVEFLTDGEELVIIATAVKEEVVEEEEELGEIEVEGEPEVIEHGKKEDEESED